MTAGSITPPAVHPEGRPYSISTYVNHDCRCDGCRTARRKYQQAKHGHRPRLNKVAFIEDYEFLISTGETHPERLAIRLGMASVPGMETMLRRFYGQYVAAGTLPTNRKQCAA